MEEELYGQEVHLKEHEDDHIHKHPHPNVKAVSNRLAKAIGHLEKVKRMVDNGEVRSAINNAGKVILSEHINHCIIDAVQENDFRKIDELNEAILNLLSDIRIL